MKEFRFLALALLVACAPDASFRVPKNTPLHEPEGPPVRVLPSGDQEFTTTVVAKNLYVQNTSRFVTAEINVDLLKRHGLVIPQKTVIVLDNSADADKSTETHEIAVRIVNPGNNEVITVYVAVGAALERVSKTGSDGSNFYETASELISDSVLEIIFGGMFPPQDQSPRRFINIFPLN